MNDQAIKETLPRALGDIAPEADPATIKTDVDLRDRLDVDSMDFLNVVTAINEELGVEIPEVDYSQLVTFDGLVEYPSVCVPA